MLMNIAVTPVLDYLVRSGCFYIYLLIAAVPHPSDMQSRLYELARTKHPRSRSTDSVISRRHGRNTIHMLLTSSRSMGQLRSLPSHKVLDLMLTFLETGQFCVPFRLDTLIHAVVYIVFGHQPCFLFNQCAFTSLLREIVCRRCWWTMLRARKFLVSG